MDSASIEKLYAPLELKIKRENNTYHITGKYYVAENEISLNGPYEIEKTITSLPAVVKTQAGTLTLTKTAAIHLKTVIRNMRIWSHRATKPMNTQAN